MIKFYQYAIACLFFTLFFLENVQSTLALEGGTFKLNLGMTFPDKVGGIDYKTGTIGSAGFGVKSGAVRYEFEFKGILGNIKTPGGDILFMSGLYNLYYDFEGLNVDLVPYLAGGAGLTYAKSGVSQTDSSKPKIIKRQMTVGFQIKVGVNYVMTEAFSWNLGYEYFRTLKIKNLANDNFKAHMIALGVIWYIG